MLTPRHGRPLQCLSVVLPQSLPRCLPPLSSCRLYLVAPRTTAAVRRSATAPTGPTQHLYRRLRHLTCSIQCTNAQTRPRIADFSSTGLGGIVGVTYDDVNVARRRYVQYSRVASICPCSLPPPPRRPPLPTSARPASAADWSTQQAQHLHGAATAAAAAGRHPDEGRQGILLAITGRHGWRGHPPSAGAGSASDESGGGCHPGGSKRAGSGEDGRPYVGAATATAAVAVAVALEWPPPAAAGKSRKLMGSRRRCRRHPPSPAGVVRRVTTLGVTPAGTAAAAASGAARCEPVAATLDVVAGAAVPSPVLLSTSKSAASGSGGRHAVGSGRGGDGGACGATDGDGGADDARDDAFEAEESVSGDPAASSSSSRDQPGGGAPSRPVGRLRRVVRYSCHCHHHYSRRRNPSSCPHPR